VGEEAHSVRLDRVENEVGAIRSEMGGLRTEMGRVQADVKGLGAILSRIEEGVVRAQDQQDQRELRSRQSPVAIATMLVTVLSMLVGGSWLISGNMSRMDERSIWVQREQDRMEQRLWGDTHMQHGGADGEQGQAHQ
jgi:hypothetical protein